MKNILGRGRNKKTELKELSSRIDSVDFDCQQKKEIEAERDRLLDEEEAVFSSRDLRKETGANIQMQKDGEYWIGKYCFYLAAMIQYIMIRKRDII